MAQHGSGEQYVKEGQHGTDEYVHNPLQSTTGAAHGHEQGGKGAVEQIKEKLPGGGDHGCADKHKAGTHGHEQGGKGTVEQIKDKLPGGGDHGCADKHKAATTTTGDHGFADGHEKKGVMEKIKEKIPGGQQ